MVESLEIPGVQNMLWAQGAEPAERELRAAAHGGAECPLPAAAALLYRLLQAHSAAGAALEPCTLSLDRVKPLQGSVPSDNILKLLQ